MVKKSVLLMSILALGVTLGSGTNAGKIKKSDDDSQGTLDRFIIYKGNPWERFAKEEAKKRAEINKRITKAKARKMLQQVKNYRLKKDTHKPNPNTPLTYY